MADILLRDIPEEVVSAIDARARRLGLSRNEYLRRTLATSVESDLAITADDLTRFAETFADLADPDVMRDAWSSPPFSKSTSIGADAGRVPDPGH